MTGTHIVVLVLICLIFSAVHAWIKQRGAIRQATDPDAERMLEKIDVLEERIRVLERIVTEHNIDLKQQIDNL